LVFLNQLLINLFMIFVLERNETCLQFPQNHSDRINIGTWLVEEGFVLLLVIKTFPNLWGTAVVVHVIKVIILAVFLKSGEPIVTNFDLISFIFILFQEDVFRCQMGMCEW